MKIKKLLIGISTALAGSLAIALLFISNATTDIQASTAQGGDVYTDGCISCHVNGDDGDLRISTIIETKYPKHPKLAAIKNLPDDCSKCHKTGAKFGVLSELMHKDHYKSDKFTNDMKGDCLSCHSFDKASGKVGNKSAAKNW